MNIHSSTRVSGTIDTQDSERFRLALECCPKAWERVADRITLGQGFLQPLSAVDTERSLQSLSPSAFTHCCLTDCPENPHLSKGASDHALSLVMRIGGPFLLVGPPESDIMTFPTPESWRSACEVSLLITGETRVFRLRTRSRSHDSFSFHGLMQQLPRIFPNACADKLPIYVRFSMRAKTADNSPLPPLNGELSILHSPPVVPFTALSTPRILLPLAPSPDPSQQSFVDIGSYVAPIYSADVQSLTQCLSDVPDLEHVMALLRAGKYESVVQHLVNAVLAQSSLVEQNVPELRVF